MSAIDTAKEAVMLVQKIDNIELYKKILDLQSDALKMVEENGKLKSEVQELEEAFKIKDTLLFCTYCNKCLYHVLEDPLGCYDSSRYASYGTILKAIMSVYQSGATTN